MDRIGRYRIIGELGRGAMGIVYHAVDPSIGRSVAIKTIRIQDIGDTAHRERLRTRLFREARSAGVLSHPNIVTIYDMDEVDGLAYIAMAFVNGPPLEKILGSDKPLSGTVMLRILSQAAAALDYAHGKGIIHRDVKPANIMTDEDGAVKITDFGIAKFASAGHNTETKTITGTPNYMSPEQVQGQGIDGRSDQFSLAVIAYEILTGERPFSGEALGTVVYKIVAEQPAPAHRLNGTLNEKIDGVLRKALSKKPDDRYASCSEFIRALESACADSRGWQTVAANTASLLPTAFLPGRDSGILQTADLPPRTPAAAPWRKQSVLIPATLSVLVVAGFALFGTFGMRSHPATPEVAVAEPPVGSPSVEATKPETPKPDTEFDIPDIPGMPAKPATSNTANGVEQPANGVPGTVTAQYQSIPTSSGSRSTQASRTNNRRVAVRIPVTEDIWVSSNPGGAKAVLDDNFITSCQTPCTLRAAQGHHRVMFSLPGFVSEKRDVAIAETPVDVPAVTLHEFNGSVMVSSNPTGAGLRVDGKPISERTPVTISLPPGDHLVAVERNGQVVERKFAVHAGSLKPWSVSFPP